MRHTVYILYSQSIGKYYVGQTEDLNTRLILHNSGFFEGASTKAGIPWEVFFTIICFSRTQALAIEKHIKKMKSIKYYHSLKLYPEMVEKLLEKYTDC